MAGKICIGSNVVPNDPALSRAYCEGRTAAAAGALIGTNPHPANTPANTIWGLGHQSWAADPAGVPRDCCADAYGGGYTP